MTYRKPVLCARCDRYGPIDRANTHGKPEMDNTHASAETYCDGQVISTITDMFLFLSKRIAQKNSQPLYVHHLSSIICCWKMI